MSSQVACGPGSNTDDAGPLSSPDAETDQESDANTLAPGFEVDVELRFVSEAWLAGSDNVFLHVDAPGTHSIRVEEGGSFHVVYRQSERLTVRSVVGFQRSWPRSYVFGFAQQPMVHIHFTQPETALPVDHLIPWVCGNASVRQDYESGARVDLRVNVDALGCIRPEGVPVGVTLYSSANEPVAIARGYATYSEDDDSYQWEPTLQDSPTSFSATIETTGAPESLGLEILQIGVLWDANHRELEAGSSEFTISTLGDLPTLDVVASYRGGRQVHEVRLWDAAPGVPFYQLPPVLTAPALVSATRTDQGALRIESSTSPTADDLGDVSWLFLGPDTGATWTALTKTGSTVFELPSLPEGLDDFDAPLDGELFLAQVDLWEDHTLEDLLAMPYPHQLLVSSPSARERIARTAEELNGL